MAKKMNKEIINLAYIKDRQYSIIEAVERNNIEPFKAFYRKWLQHKGSLPDTSDLTFTIAARKICVQLDTIPAKTKEKAKKWLEEFEMKEDPADGTAKVTRMPEEQEGKEE